MGKYYSDFFQDNQVSLCAHKVYGEREDSVRTHSLKSHCYTVAEITGETLKPIRCYHLGCLVGLLHDMGKATAKFQNYLEKAARGDNVTKGSVIHTFQGVQYIWDNYHESDNGVQILTSEIVAYAIGAHHGLFDCVGLDEVGIGDFIYRVRKDKKEINYDEAVIKFFTQITTEDEVHQLFQKAVEEVALHIGILVDSFSRGLFARLVLSALINADRVDTAEFMENTILTRQSCDKNRWLDNLSFCEEKIENFPKDNPMYSVRMYISNSCKENAQRSPGIYQLNVPTGGGKTLASHRYALSHAAEYKKKRIIYIIPLLSILDQNKKVIHEFTKEQNIIMEHHSNVVQEDEQDDLQYRKQIDTWDSPIMISTMVQFLNILFSGRTSAIRRMQALINSVIVLDEVQSLPWKVTYMFNKAINFLAKLCQCTIVLSSATQPDYSATKCPISFAENPELVIADEELYKVFKRTEIVDKTIPGGYSLDGVAEFAFSEFETVSSMLIICNTKKTALELHKLATEQGYQVFHLSTGMCMKHRCDVIEEINRLLNYNKTTENKIRFLCVSTQLVEAGVDFSFERVIRLIAGMDNIIQSAGRENRSFDYGMVCPCYILNLNTAYENLNYLQEIRQRQNATYALLNAFQTYPDRYNNDLSSDKSIQGYYTALHRELSDKRTFEYCTRMKDVTRYLYQELSKDIDDDRGICLTQPFKTVGDTFEVFDTKTMDVLVPYREQGRQLITELLSQKMMYDYRQREKLLRQAAEYSINLFKYQVDDLKGCIKIYDIDGDKILYLEESCYQGDLHDVGFEPDGKLEELIFC